MPVQPVPAFLGQPRSATTTTYVRLIPATQQQAHAYSPTTRRPVQTAMPAPWAMPAQAVSACLEQRPSATTTTFVRLIPATQQQAHAYSPTTPCPAPTAMPARITMYVQMESVPERSIQLVLRVSDNPMGHPVPTAMPAPRA